MLFFVFIFGFTSAPRVLIPRARVAGRPQFADWWASRWAKAIKDSQLPTSLWDKVDYTNKMMVNVGFYSNKNKRLFVKIHLQIEKAGF